MSGEIPSRDDRLAALCGALTMLGARAEPLGSGVAVYARDDGVFVVVDGSDWDRFSWSRTGKHPATDVPGAARQILADLDRQVNP